MRTRPLYDVVALLMRLGVGAIFIAHGWQKVQVGIATTATSFHHMGVPAATPMAVYATFIELLGGAALIAGIAVPVAGALLFLDMAGAFAFVNAKHGIFLVDNGRPRGGFELVLALGLASLLLASGGAGRLTLDNYLFGRSASRADARSARTRPASENTSTAPAPPGRAEITKGKGSDVLVAGPGKDDRTGPGKPSDTTPMKIPTEFIEDG